MAKVTIIDYGAGNLLSVQRAFEYCGAEVIIATNPSQIFQAEKLVLPGVGAFANGMAGLRERGLIEPISQYGKADRPFMGICLGMQLMLEVGEEFGIHEGLGLLKGRVVQVPDNGNGNGIPHKIPHIGWSELAPSGNGNSWDNTVLKNITHGESCYFVHSFMVEPEVEAHRLANTCYNGWQISAVIKFGNLYGCQFHPEKSGPVGLRIIKNFIED